MIVDPARVDIVSPALFRRAWHYLAGATQRGTRPDKMPSTRAGALSTVRTPEDMEGNLGRGTGLGYIDDIPAVGTGPARSRVRAARAGSGRAGLRDTRRAQLLNPMPAALSTWPIALFPIA